MRTLIIVLLVANLAAGVALVAGVGADTPAPSPAVDELPVVAGNLTLLDDVADPPQLRRDAAPLAVMPGAPVPAEAPTEMSKETSKETVRETPVEPSPNRQPLTPAAAGERAPPPTTCVLLGPFPDGARAEATLAPHLRELGIGALERIESARFHEVQLPLPERPAPLGEVPAALAAQLAEAGFPSPDIDTSDGQPVLLLETRRQPEPAADRLQALLVAGHATARVVATGSGDWLRMRLAPPMRAPLATVATRAGVRLLPCPPAAQ